MVDIHQVGTSCGFSVPTYEWTGYRTTLHDFFDKKVACEEEGNRKEGIEVYVTSCSCSHQDQRKQEY